MAARLTADLHTKTEALAASEFRWKFAVEGSGDGLWDWDVASGKVFLSAQWKQMLGHADDEIGDGLDEWESRIHPDDLQETMAKVSAYLEGKILSYASEHRVRCKDGSYKWVLDRGMVVSRDNTGRPLRMIGTHTDITERKRLENDREQYLKFFQLSGEAMCIINATGHFTHVNPSMTKLTFYNEHELTAPPFLEFVHPDDRDKTRNEVEWLISGGVAIEFKNRYVRKDGSVVALSWNAYLDQNDGMIYASARDVTAAELDSARIEQLARMYAMLSACNSAILHCFDAEGLFSEVCDIVVRIGKMDMAWIGIADTDSRKILPVAQAGDHADYLNGIEVSMDADDPHGRGPTGTAVRENRPIWVQKFMADERA